MIRLLKQADGRLDEMSKIAIVTDSNSGITQGQAKEIGIHVLPMPFMIDGETFYEEITLSQEAFYQKLAQNADISTSQPSPESIMQLWDELLKENDEIVHIPRVERFLPDSGYARTGL